MTVAEKMAEDWALYHSSKHISKLIKIVADRGMEEACDTTDNTDSKEQIRRNRWWEEEA